MQGGQWRCSKVPKDIVINEVSFRKTKHLHETVIQIFFGMLYLLLYDVNLPKLLQVK
jgi:hypothetical protein